MLHRNLKLIALSAVVLLGSSSAALATTDFGFNYNISNILGANNNQPGFTDPNPYSNYVVNGINDSGTLVGQWVNYDGSQAGFVGASSIEYGPSNSANPAAFPVYSSVVNGINSAGDIVGAYSLLPGNQPDQGFYSTASAYGAASPTQNIIDTNTHGSEVISTIATGISDNGTVVGYDQLASGVEYSFTYNTATQVLTELTPAGIAGDTSAGFHATAISNNGEWIVGDSYDTNNVGTGFIYNTQTNVWTSFGVSVPGQFATGVNNMGLVVGTDLQQAWTPVGASYASFVYDAVAGTFLNNLIVDPYASNVTQVTSINNHDVLAGYSDQTWAFTATVPVPATVWLVMAGMGLLIRRQAKG